MGKENDHDAEPAYPPCTCAEGLPNPRDISVQAVDVALDERADLVLVLEIGGYSASIRRRDVECLGERRHSFIHIAVR